MKSMTRVRISIFCFNFHKCLHGFFSDQILILQAIQKQHLVMESIHRLRQKASDTASQVESLQTELGQAKSSLEAANSDNNRLLGQLEAAEKKKDELQAELDALKKSRKKDCEDVNNAGFNEAEENYKKQVFATQDIYFKAGWKAACQQLGQGPDTDVFASPPAVFLPTYLIPYANDVFSMLQAEAKEGLEEEGEAEAEGEDQTEQEQAGQTGTGVQDQTATVNLEADEEFPDLSPLA